MRGLHVQRPIEYTLMLCCWCIVLRFAVKVYFLAWSLLAEANDA